MAEKTDEEAQSPASKSGNQELEMEQSFIFHDEWAPHDRIMTELMIDSLQDAFPGYELPEGIEFKENPDKGRYHRRSSNMTDGEVPLVEVNPDRRYESMAHELGHDVHYQFIDYIHDNRVVRSSFKEAFADLLMFYAVKATPESRDLDRDISQYDSEFEALRQMLDPGKREEEIETLRKAGLALYEDDEESLNTHARNLVEIPPEYGRTTAVDLISNWEGKEDEYRFMLVEDANHSRDNLFIANIDLGRVSFDDIARNKMDIWRLSEVLRHSGSYPVRRPVEEALEDNSRIGEKIRFTAKSSESYSHREILERPQKILKDTVEGDIELAHRMIDNYLQSLRDIDNLPDQVLEDLEDVKYGNSYDEKVDFPHNVGGEYAEELYREGVTPYDLLIHKDEHVEALEQRLQDEIGQRL